MSKKNKVRKPGLYSIKIKDKYPTVSSMHSLKVEPALWTGVAWYIIGTQLPVREDMVESVGSCLQEVDIMAIQKKRKEQASKIITIGRKIIS